MFPRFDELILQVDFCFAFKYTSVNVFLFDVNVITALEKVYK